MKKRHSYKRVNAIFGTFLILVLFICGCNPSKRISNMLNGNTKEDVHDYRNMYINGTTGNLQGKDLEAFNKAKEVYDLYLSDCESDKEIVEKAHDYIVLNCTYDSEALENDTLTNDDFSAYGVFIKHTAVCEGYAKAMKMLLDIAGIENIIVTGTVADNVSHAWNMVKLGDDWFHTDVTFDDPIPETGEIVRMYLNVSDETIKKDHFWNYDTTPPALSDEYDYLKENGNICDDLDDLKYNFKECEKNGEKNLTILWEGNTEIDENTFKEAISDTDIRNIDYTSMGTPGRFLYILSISY